MPIIAMIYPSAFDEAFSMSLYVVASRRLPEEFSNLAKYQSSLPNQHQEARRIVAVFFSFNV
jgi:hypothetical protein